MLLPLDVFFFNLGSVSVFFRSSDQTFLTVINLVHSQLNKPEVPKRKKQITFSCLSGILWWMFPHFQVSLSGCRALQNTSTTSELLQALGLVSGLHLVHGLRLPRLYGEVLACSGSLLSGNPPARVDSFLEIGKEQCKAPMQRTQRFDKCGSGHTSIPHISVIAGCASEFSLDSLFFSEEV